MRYWLLVAVFTPLLGSCDSPAVESGTVQLEPLATLSFDTLFAPTPTAVVGMARGGSRTAVTPDNESGEIYLFLDGTFEAAYVARGNGPAEISRVEDLVFGANDTLYVLDSDNSKVLLLTPSFHYARSIPIGPGARRVALSDEGAILVAIEDPGSIEVREIGANDSVSAVASVATSRSTVTGSALMASSPEGVWIASGGVYRVQLLSAEGRVTGEVVRRPEWWDYEPDNADRFAAGIGTESRLLGLSAEQGVLWILAGTPPQRYPDAAPDELDFSDPAVINQLGDHVIEAVDPASGDLMGSLRIDELGTRLLPGGFAWALEYDESGESRISVFRLKTGGASS